MANKKPTPEMAALFSRAGVNPRDRGVTPNDAIEKVMQFLMSQSPQNQRFWLKQGLGANDNAMFALMEFMKDPENGRNLKKIMEGFAPKPEDIERAQELQKQTGILNAALDNLARKGFPVLTAIINGMVAALEFFDSSGKKEQGDTQVTGPERSFWNRYNELMGKPPLVDSGAAGGPGKAGGMQDAGTTWKNFLAGLGYLESDYAGGANRGGGSAKGIFQFTDATARDAVNAGIPDPRVGTYEQQAAATMAFIKKFEPRAAAAIEKGDMAGASAMLRERWPSLPGGRQQQGADRYKRWNDILQGGGPRPPSSNNVTVGTINVTSSKADPKAVADQIPDAMKRYAMLGGINSGLT
jgi:hypothetical protein